MADDKCMLIVWSDNCVSQNQCWLVLFFHGWLLKTKLFYDVKLRMLEIGHTYTVCDLFFGGIEQECYAKQLETQHDYMSCMEKSGCIAVEMKQEFMFQWDFLKTHFQKTR